MTVRPLALMELRLRPDATFADDATGLEPVERERSGKRMRLIMRDHVRKAPAGCRRCLEAAITPTAIQVETFDRCLAHDRASIHRHVHNARPVPHDAQAADRRKQL